MITIRINNNIYTLNTDRDSALTIDYIKINIHQKLKDKYYYIGSILIQERDLISIDTISYKRCLETISAYLRLYLLNGSIESLWNVINDHRQ